MQILENRGETYVGTVNAKDGKIKSVADRKFVEGLKEGASRSNSTLKNLGISVRQSVSLVGRRGSTGVPNHLAERFDVYLRDRYV